MSQPAKRCPIFQPCRMPSSQDFLLYSYFLWYSVSRSVFDLTAFNFQLFKRTSDRYVHDLGTKFSVEVTSL